MGYTVAIHLTSGGPIILNGSSLQQVNAIHEALNDGQGVGFVVNGKDVRVQFAHIVQVVVDPAP